MKHHGVKPGTGAVTEHGDMKQFGKGPGAHNTPLKKSPVNSEPPQVKEAHPRADNVPQPPKINAGAAGPSGGKRVINTETHPAGRNSTGSTYKAPRREEGHDPVECGYTKPGKM